MSNRNTRGSQSLVSLSENPKPARGRGQGRGGSQGRGRSHKQPQPAAQPLLDAPSQHWNHPQPGPPHNYPPNPPSNYPNPPNYPPNPYNYPSNPPANYLQNPPANYPQNPPANYPQNPPANYPQNPPANYPQNHPANYPQNPPAYYPSNHPLNPPANYPPNPSPNYLPTHGPNQQNPSFVPPQYPSNPPVNPNRNRHNPPLATKPIQSNQPKPKGSDSSFLDMKDLLQALMQAPYQKLSSKTITNKFKCSERALDTVCANNKKLLSVSEGVNGFDVDLAPNIKICNEYLSNDGCNTSEHCGKFHICQAFASGECPESSKCEFGHLWKTSHNKKLVDEMMMDSFAEPLLNNLMKKVVLRKVGISVCKSYNEGTCGKGKQCRALHICEKQVFGSGKCETETCTLNHDILEPKCLSLLTVAGIDTNDSKRDILAKIRKLIQYSDKGPKEESKPEPLNLQNRDLKKNDAPAKPREKLDCFQAIEEQELVVLTVVRSLVSTFNYWNFFDKLQEQLDIGPGDFLKLLQLYKKTFLVYESGTRTLVKLQPKIDLCAHYKSMEKCHAGKNCNFLHLCREFVSGNCKNPKCTRLHRLNASPNNEVLMRHFLLNIPEGLVINYLRTRFGLGSLPYICFPYNYGNCSSNNCPQLHVCYDVLFTLKTCYRKDCYKSHDVMSDHNRSILSSVANADDYVIKNALSARVSSVPKKTEKAEPVKNSNKKKESKQKKSTTKPKPNPTCTDFKNKSDNKETKADQPVAKSSFRLDGNVIVPEICIDHIQDTCHPATNMCPKLHARVAYHWQFCLNGAWMNFAFLHSNHLEKQYRDVAQTTADLFPLEHGRTAEEKQTCSMLKDNGLTVDFDKMELSSLQSPTVAVRRIGTISSAITTNKFATVFGWFFKDKNGIWIEYGNCDSTGIENHSTTVTSMDIEQAYSSNPFTLQMTTGQFTYTLNFQNMTQINDETRVVRDVRRRPKHVVIETLKPDDPYDLDRAKNTPVPPKDTIKQSSQAQDVSGKYPSFWTKMDGPGPKFYSVNPSSAEGSELVRSILLSMPSAEILGIRRLQNTFHYDSFDNQMEYRKALTKKPVLNIQRLFHGTREKHVHSISSMNFEFRQEYADSGHKFGRGAYFFNNAALAHQFASNLAGEDSSSPVVLAVADVYVGTVAVGNATMVRPPADASGALTDTTVDNMKVPSIFVKYNNREYCPHYFINIKV